MKKILSIVLTILMIFAAVSCSDSHEDATMSTVSLVFSGEGSKAASDYIKEDIVYGASTVQYGTWSDLKWDISYSIQETSDTDITSITDWTSYTDAFRVKKGQYVYAKCSNNKNDAVNQEIVTGMFKAGTVEKITATRQVITLVPAIDEKVAFDGNSTGKLSIGTLTYVVSDEQYLAMYGTTDTNLVTATDNRTIEVKVTCGEGSFTTTTNITTSSNYKYGYAELKNIELIGIKTKSSATPTDVVLEFKEPGSTSDTNLYELSTSATDNMPKVYILNGLTTTLESITVTNTEIKIGTVEIVVTDSDIFSENYNIPTHFYFESEDAGATVTLKAEGSGNNPIEIVYSVNNLDFKDYTIGTPINTSKVGDRVYFRAKNVNSSFSKNETNYYQFVLSGKMKAEGCINYLLEKDGIVDALSEYCFCSLFEGCSNLTSAPELPSKTLASHCYDSMFRGCTSLTTAPVLPATTMKNSCYHSMFYGCSSLTSAPELSSVNLANSCYMLMFSRCTSLTTAPYLPAEVLQPYCYRSMFDYCVNLNSISVGFKVWPDYNWTWYWIDNVSSTGTFKCPAELPEKHDTYYNSMIPVNWTVIRRVL